MRDPWDVGVDTPMAVWSICSKPSDLGSPKRPETKMDAPFGEGYERQGHLPARALANLERLDQTAREKVPVTKGLLQWTCIWVTKISLMALPPRGP